MSRDMTRRSGGSVNRSWIALASTMAVAAVSVAVYAYSDRKKRAERSGRDERRSRGSGSDEDLEARFNVAAKRVHTIPNIPQQDQLRLYGLYKQSIVGDAADPPTSLSFLNPIAGVKFQAWEANKGMSKDAAMEAYIDLIDDILNGSSREYNDSDAMMDAIWGDAGGGMGNKPSSLAYGDDDDDYDEYETAEEEEQDDDGNDITTGHGRLALHKAARDDQVDVLREILTDPSADPNALDESGQTALHLAADRGHPECIKVLLDAKADVNAADSDGISVLQVAVITGRADACKILLERGADPDQADHDGDTPRSSAEDDEVIKKLIAGYPAVSTDEILRKLDSVNIDISDEDDGDLC